MSLLPERGRRGVGPTAPTEPMVPPSLASLVVRWQRQHGRHDLPWQGTRDPYRVWLSEIMLQQTQVKTVLAYYDAFLARFPTVQRLAAVPLDDVLAAWSGLGYYSRARNLHRCAQQVVAVHQGIFPKTAEALATLPGIGPSTAAAIAAFCHGERAAILDGNVKRVLSRVAAFEGDLAQSAQEKALWRAAQAALPLDEADMPAYTQGLMDLGATVCLARRPNCLICPLQAPCGAQAAGSQERLPIRSRKLKRSARESWWLILRDGDRLWLQQRDATGVWAGLWAAPLIDSEEQALDALSELGALPAEPLPTLKHALTHFDWTLHPVVAVVPAQVAAGEAKLTARLGAGRWFARETALGLGLPAPLRKLIPLISR